MNPEENATPKEGGQEQVASTPNPADHRKVMGILAYLGPLVIVSFLVAKDDSFVKFHIKQGLVLFVIEIGMWFLGMFLVPFLWFILNLVNLAVLVLIIIGILNVVGEREKMLPVVGSFAHYFTF